MTTMISLVQLAGCFEATESIAALMQLELSQDCSASAWRLVEPSVRYMFQALQLSVSCF